MAAKKASGPACDCGQVVFDLAGKQSGDFLRCPWCRQKYRLEEDGTVTPVGGPSGDSTKRMSDKAPSSSSRPRGVRNRVEAEEASVGEEEVEVFRYDSAQEEEEKEPKPSSERSRKARPRDIASDATEPLDRISRRRTRRIASSKSANAEDGGDLDEQPLDELPPIKPLDLEKWVARMFLGMIPLGTLFFMGYAFYGIYTGERELITYKIFGVTIRGDNPWVWFGGIVMGALVFLGIWVLYVYFFVHKKKLAEMEEERRKKADGGEGSRRGGRRSRRTESE